MDSNTNEYLPEYVFDGLKVRVFDKLKNFYANCLPKGNSDVIDACKKIEANVNQVYSVIEDFRKRFQQTLSNGFKFRHMLASVLVILYYKHRDEDAYKMVVFKQLVGEFENKFSPSTIKGYIDEMLKEDAMLESLKAKRTGATQHGQSDVQDKENSIVLADKRGSDLVRVILAMCHCSYFVHQDGTVATPTEVGSLLMKLFGRNTEWKSLLQKAYDRDYPLKTFDELRDVAEKYWNNKMASRKNKK
jgi:hypothetical protein